MIKLKLVRFTKKNEQLTAVETYSDNSIKEIPIKNGIVNYILEGT